MGGMDEACALWLLKAGVKLTFHVPGKYSGGTTQRNPRKVRYPRTKHRLEGFLSDRFKT